MAIEVPKKVIVVLLVLVILISVFGTYVIIDKANKININKITPKQKASGEISLKIANPNLPKDNAGTISIRIGEREG